MKPVSPKMCQIVIFKSNSPQPLGWFNCSLVCFVLGFLPGCQNLKIDTDG